MKANENRTKKNISDVFPIINKDLRIIIYLIIFTMSGVVFNSCVGGYVASEPVYDYSYYNRPARPGEAYIWIDGDWLWNRRTHNYVHERGYWVKARRGHSYEPGYWESGPQGKMWIKGRWRKIGDNDRYSNRHRGKDWDGDKDRRRYRDRVDRDRDDDRDRDR